MTIASRRPLAALGLLFSLVSLRAAAQEAAAEESSDVPKKIRASHENLDPNAQIDEFGALVPVPVSHPARRFPADQDFPTGPAIGERLPDFTLPNQHGEQVDFHRHRGGRKAAVTFQRSVVW